MYFKKLRSLFALKILFKRSTLVRKHSLVRFTFTFTILLNQNEYCSMSVKRVKFKHELQDGYARCYILLKSLITFLIHAYHKGKQRIVLFKDSQVPFPSNGMYITDIQKEAKNIT